MTIREMPRWQQIVTEKRKLRDDAISKFLKSQSNSPRSLPQNRSADTHVAAQELAIDDIQETQKAISSGAVTASSLCIAYIHRLTEILFQDAVNQARELDESFKRTGNLVGPLHGVVMTLKDQFDVKGYDSTLGYVGRSFKPATQDCVLVSLLQRMGAIIIAKSNLPQSIMWCETDNPLWGVTVHPQNPDFTSGGSTGGEATLLSLRGTVIGWGTDIGGSIRIPSHMNGLYGLKPSSTRLPYQGVSVSTDGQEHVPSVIGPMSRSIDSLIDITKAVIDSTPSDHDPKCCPLTWRPELFQDAKSRPLVIAVMRDDGVVKPHPPIARILEEVVGKLQAAGHEVVPWTPGTLHKDYIDIMDQYYTADGCEDIQRDVGVAGEPLIPHVETLVNRGKPISVYEYWQLNKQRNTAQKRYLDLWNSTESPTTGKPIDILLTPVMPHSAVPHRTSRWVGYTKIFNFVDYSVVVIPAGKVDKDLDGEAVKCMGEYQPRSPMEQYVWGLCDLEKMHGMPVGVQIVARRLQEEKVLGAAKMIDELLKTEMR